MVGILSLLLFCSPMHCAGQNKAEQNDGTAAPSQRIIDTEPVPDGQLEERIRSVISNISDFKNVRVSVSDGVVKLTGEIPRAEGKEKLERLVSRFRGVVYVDNKLKAATDVDTRLGPVLDTLREYMERTVAQIPLLTVALGVAGLLWFLGWLIRHIALQYGWFGINPLLKTLISKMFVVVFALVGIIIALDILDVTALAGAVVGTTGIVGLALGFAFKDIVENYLAGLLLSTRSLFSINDHVTVGDHEGRVVRLTSREIVIMTLDGNHLLIPNSTVFKSVIVNFTRNNLRRFDFPIGVGVSEDLVLVRKVGVETLQAMKGVIHDPGPFMRVDNLGDFAVNVRFFGWIDQRSADYFKVKSEAIRLLKDALSEAGIDVPFPTSVQYTRIETHEVPVPEPEVKPKVEVEAAAGDVSVDTQLDKQIETDLKTSEEDNYLKHEPS